jgi:predicted nucleic acid-binding protein
VANFIIIDTDVLIDAGHGVAVAVACLQGIENQSAPAVSVVTQMELFVGCRNGKELQEVEKFLRRFHLLKLTGQVSDTGVDLLRRYRLSHGLLIADALIAATAIVFNVPFVSKNQRDYRFIEGLNLLAYP